MKKATEFLRQYYPRLESLAGSNSISKVGESLRNLQRGLTGDRNLAGESYFSNSSYLAAYLLYYWPVSFIQTSCALKELQMRGVLPELRNVLDLGAGPGPASFAARGFGAGNSTLVDASAAALARAAALNDSLPGDLKLNLTCLSHDLESKPILPAGSYDLIVACHSVNELWKAEPDSLGRRATLISTALHLLTENGILLIIEPAALSSSRPALELRNMLLQKKDDAGRPACECVGPCTGSFLCPMPEASESRTCHSEWLWDPFPAVAELARAAGLDRSSAKATWFALRRAPPTSDRFNAPAPALAPQKPSAPSLPLAAAPELNGRVVSEPMLNKAGRLRLIVCTNQGLATFSAKSNDAAAKAAGFHSLRRGDCINANSLERRTGENSFGFIPESRLSVTLSAPEAR